MYLIRLLLSKFSKKETNLDVKNTINDLASLVVELTKGKRSNSIGSNSVYIKTNDRVIRISDHTSVKSRSVNVLVTSEGIKIKCIKTGFICKDINTAANKITNLIGVYGILNSYYCKILTLGDANDRLRAELKSLKELKDLDKNLKDLNTKLANSTNNNAQLRDQLNKLRNETKLVSRDSEEKSIQITNLEKEIKEISKECIEYKAIAKEGKEIIQNLLCSPDVGRAMFTDGEHKFYLDHFPTDAQELLKNIIKEYYNK